MKIYKNLKKVKNLDCFIGRLQKQSQQNNPELKLKYIKFERRVMIGTSIIMGILYFLIKNVGRLKI